MAELELRIAACPNPKYNWSNRTYVNKETFLKLKAIFEAKGGTVSSNDLCVNLNVGPWVFLTRCRTFNTLLFCIYFIIYIF